MLAILLYVCIQNQSSVRGEEHQPSRARVQKGKNSKGESFVEYLSAWSYQELRDDLRIILMQDS